MYKRFGPNSAYSKQRLVSYRAPFLATRAAELRAAIEQALVDGGADPPSLHAERVLASADRSHVHLLGHSFGAASVLLVGQQLEQLERDLQQAREEAEDSALSAAVEPAPPRIATVSLLDPWLSSAGEAAVARGLRTPLLAMLSRGWCDGNEFNLTRALVLPAPRTAYLLLGCPKLVSRTADEALRAAWKEGAAACHPCRRGTCRGCAHEQVSG